MCVEAIDLPCEFASQTVLTVPTPTSLCDWVERVTKVPYMGVIWGLILAMLDHMLACLVTAQY